MLCILERLGLLLVLCVCFYFDSLREKLGKVSGGTQSFDLSISLHLGLSLSVLLFIIYTFYYNDPLSLTIAASLLYLNLSQSLNHDRLLRGAVILQQTCVCDNKIHLIR